MPPTTPKTSRRKSIPPPPPKHTGNAAGAELALRTVRDELQQLPADIERAASYLDPNHPYAVELRDMAGTLRNVRLGVARVAIWLEDARQEAHAHG